MCSVILPGYMDGELIKIRFQSPDSKVEALQSFRVTKKKTRKNYRKISFIDSDEVMIAEHKRELSNFQDVELQKGKIEMEVKVKDSNAEIMKRRRIPRKSKRHENAKRSSSPGRGE